MITKLTHVSLVVPDQEEALHWYTEKLGFEKRADDSSTPGPRWLTIAPRNTTGPEIVLYTAGPNHTPEQRQSILAQVGHQSHMVFATDDCRGDIETFRKRGVKVGREPEQLPWGTQAVVEDLYGNSIILVQPPKAS